jgi:hypothetical protein
MPPHVKPVKKGNYVLKTDLNAIIRYIYFQKTGFCTDSRCGERPTANIDFQFRLIFCKFVIVEKWINYFVYHKDVEFEKITKRLK